MLPNRRGTGMPEHTNSDATVLRPSMRAASSLSGASVSTAPGVPDTNAQPLGAARPNDDQRQSILTAAISAFAARGFHDATLDEIAAAAGIDQPTLADHFADKYGIFREVALGAVRVLLQAADISTATEPRPARTSLTNIITSIARTAIKHRAMGHLYREQSLYLTPEDGELMRVDLRELRLRVQRPLMVARPDLSPEDADMLATAALSVISSVSIHPTTLAEPKIQTLLTVSAMRVLESEPAVVDTAHQLAPVTLQFWQNDTSERGRILAAGISLLYRRGFRAVSIDDIARETLIDVQRVQHYYPSKAALLAEACLSGYDAVEADTERALASSTLARDVLAALSHAYVWHYFEDPKLMTVYLTETRNLDPERQAEVMRLHQYSTDRWVRTLCELRPELSAEESRFLVFSGLGIVNDWGRISRWKNDHAVKAKLQKSVLVALANLR